jgi:hypothetical protein
MTFVVLREKSEAVRQVRASDGIVSGLLELCLTIELYSKLGDTARYNPEGRNRRMESSTRQSPAREVEARL